MEKREGNETECRESGSRRREKNKGVNVKNKGVKIVKRGVPVLDPKENPSASIGKQTPFF